MARRQRRLRPGQYDPTSRSFPAAWEKPALIASESLKPRPSASHDEPAVQITLRGGYGIRDIERIIAAIEPLASLQTPSRVVLDLTRLVYIGPAALATVISIIHDANARGVVPLGLCIPPANRLVAEHLDRVGFSLLLTGTHLGKAGSHRPQMGSRPMARFTSQSEVDPLADSLAMAATEAVNISGADRMAVSIAIREIAQNVIDHASSQVGGFAIAQRSTHRDEFEIAVADAGIGIAGSLRGNPKYADLVSSDLAAITMALTRGVTGNPGAGNEGIALAAIQDFLRTNRGTLLIRSGAAGVEDGRRRRSHDHLPPLRGTLVALRLRRDEPFTFDMFAQG